jgi:signal transduction histidine kinase
MTNPELCILVCDHLYSEVEATLAVKGFEHVVAAAYKADCDRPPSDPQPIIQLVNDMGCRSAVVLGGDCIGRIRKPLDKAGITIHHTEHCLELLVNKTIIDDYFTQGVHILTPGMLSRWEDKTAEWGFQGDQAKNYFNESVSRFVLLDTGVDPEAKKTLQDFSEYAGLPTERIPVGIDHLHQSLQNIVYTIDLRNQKEVLSSKDQQLSDQVMVLDLMSRLTGMFEEGQVIEGVLELFSMLCAPREILFTPIGNNEILSLFSQPSPNPRPDIVCERLIKVEQDQPIGDDGFCLPIFYQNTKFGVLEVTGLEFPEHRDRYYNQTIQIVPVIGLALSNARNMRERERDAEKISQLNQTLNQRLVELKSTNEELEAFTYSVSHDLRSPLRAIDGFSAALVSEIGETLKDQPLHYLQRIRAGADRMGQLIDDLLKLSRSSRGDLVREQCNISIIAQEIIKSLHAKEPERNVEINIADNLIAKADMRFVKVVLENLLGNAWKYTSRTSDARISLIQDSTGFVVTDNGAGFDMAYSKRLFQPFQRLHNDKEFEGSGIGLSTVKRIIQRHGGTISAESTLGEGARFSFTFQGDEVTS